MSDMPSREPEHSPFDDLASAFQSYMARLESQGVAAAEAFRATLNPELAAALDERLGILDQSALLVAPSSPAIGERVGPYSLEKALGEGGMGRVYLARQAEPVDRLVALKLVHPWLAAELGIRFLHERRALAALDHDGIARLFDAGESPVHGMYFAMEYVEGLPIDEFCTRHRLSIEARLQLVVQVCRAIEHAHQRGVVHRDLKPDNILVRGAASSPQTKVIDFGLARVEREGVERSRLTRTGGFLGTPGFASPEQAAGLPNVDTRTDVYGLGAVLYRLLTGEVPIHVPPGADPASVIGQVEPALPSAAVANHPERAEEFGRAAGVQDHRHLVRRLRGDLDAVAMCALEKDRERRYATVGALVADLQAHLAHCPIAARRQTRVYLLSKFARRHSLAIAVSCAVAALLLTSGTFAAVSAAEARSRLDDFNLFGLVRRLRTLDEAELYDTIPLGADAGERLTSWIREVEAVLARRPEVERRRARLAAAATDRDAWDDGSGATNELRQNIDEMLARCDQMVAQEGTLTLARTRRGWITEILPRMGGDELGLWARAREELAADKRFGGFVLPQQPGLVPLGADPVSGFQEFAWLFPGGELPQRDGGRFVIRPHTCPIFVLLPGGRCWVGSQNDDPQSANFDPARSALERRRQAVQVEPFLLAKFELTQGQWQVLTGQAPRVPEGATADDAPVLPAHHFDDNELLYAITAWGLRRPTEDEWEYAARAGTTSIWWTGDDPDSLRGYANLGDQSLATFGNVEDDSAVLWDDGYPSLAPVASMRPNPWGFWHIIGNVNELCEARRDDGEAPTEGRGGSWHQGWKRSRTSWSFNWEGERKDSIGFRPAITVSRGS